MVVNHWRYHHYDSDERELAYGYFQWVPWNDSYLCDSQTSFQFSHLKFRLVILFLYMLFIGLIVYVNGRAGRCFRKKRIQRVALVHRCGGCGVPDADPEQWADGIKSGE